MTKTLKLWNGDGWNYHGDHLYVAAYSIADAVRLVNEAFCKIRWGGENRTYVAFFTAKDIKEYWCKDCWGVKMDGITPERGVWYEESRKDSPKRII